MFYFGSQSQLSSPARLVVCEVQCVDWNIKPLSVGGQRRTEPGLHVGRRLRDGTENTAVSAVVGPGKLAGTESPHTDTPAW